jgi:hypothetical protein
VLREAVRDCVLPEIYDWQKHPCMAPPAREIDNPLAMFCQDRGRCSVAAGALPVGAENRVMASGQRVRGRRFGTILKVWGQRRESMWTRRPHPDH